MEGLFKDFFKQSHIKKTLVAIKTAEITGWEKWLQVELATHFFSTPSVKEWEQEVRHHLDKRKTDGRSTVSIDFHIHQKGKHSALALEVKQGRKMAGCVQGMLRDLKKVSKIKDSQLVTRSAWFLGVHPAASRTDVLAEVDYYAKTKHGFELDHACVSVHPIGKTGYSFTVL